MRTVERILWSCLHKAVRAHVGQGFKLLDGELRGPCRDEAIQHVLRLGLGQEHRRGLSGSTGEGAQQPIGGNNRNSTCSCSNTSNNNSSSSSNSPISSSGLSRGRRIAGRCRRERHSGELGAEARLEVQAGNLGC